MIRLSVLYPETYGATFDHAYYREHHVPLVLRAWGLSRAEINRGVDGPFEAAVHLEFESREAMQAALAGEATAEVMADIANYTSISPVLQTSEMEVSVDRDRQVCGDPLGVPVREHKRQRAGVAVGPAAPAGCGEEHTGIG